MRRMRSMRSRGMSPSPTRTTENKRCSALHAAAASTASPCVCPAAVVRGYMRLKIQQCAA